jgi:predicted RNA binding protein YcfA (HicA-like mRNA interferase family)
VTRLPAVTGKQLVAALQRAGFEVVRIKGSHHYLRHPDGRASVVPVHAGEDLGRGLMAKILRATKLPREEIQRYL